MSFFGGSEVLLSWFTVRTVVSSGVAPQPPKHAHTPHIYSLPLLELGSMLVLLESRYVLIGIDSKDGSQGEGGGGRGEWAVI